MRLAIGISLALLAVLMFQYIDLNKLKNQLSVANNNLIRVEQELLQQQQLNTVYKQQEQERIALRSELREIRTLIENNTTQWGRQLKEIEHEKIKNNINNHLSDDVTRLLKDYSNTLQSTN